MLNPRNDLLCNLTEIRENPQRCAILPLILPSRKSTMHNSIQFKNGLRTRNFRPRRTFRHTGCDLACRRQSPRQSALLDRRRRQTSPSECSSGRPSECSSEFSSQIRICQMGHGWCWWGDYLSADVRRCLLLRWMLSRRLMEMVILAYAYTRFFPIIRWQNNQKQRLKFCYFLPTSRSRSIWHLS